VLLTGKPRNVGVKNNAANNRWSNAVFAPSTSSHNAGIRVYDAAGNVIETHEHKGDFKEF